MNPSKFDPDVCARRPLRRSQRGLVGQPEPRGENAPSNRHHLRVLDCDRLLDSKKVQMPEHITDLSPSICMIASLCVGILLTIASVSRMSAMTLWGSCKGAMLWAVIACVISFCYFLEEKIPFKRLCLGCLCIGVGISIPFFLVALALHVIQTP